MATCFMCKVNVAPEANHGRCVGCQKKHNDGHNEETDLIRNGPIYGEQYRFREAFGGSIVEARKAWLDKTGTPWLTPKQISQGLSHTAVKKWTPPTDEQIASLLLRAEASPRSKDGYTVSVSPRVVYDRSTAWAEYATARNTITAASNCEYCFQPAKYFEADGTPRFVIHHPHELSDSGEDVRWNIARIHFDCHDAAHNSAQAAEINKVLLQRLNTVELHKQQEVVNALLF